MTGPATRQREPQAEAWFALLLAAELPALPALSDVATALADLADPAGLLDPAPTVAELAAATSWPRTAVRRAVSVLVASGHLAVGDTTRLTLPSGRPETDDEPEVDW